LFFFFFNKNKVYKKTKREFRGNKYTNQSGACTKSNSTGDVPSPSLISSNGFVEEVDHSIGGYNYNILINFSILKKLVQNICSCPDCDGGLIFTVF